jgi:arylsulfatase
MKRVSENSMIVVKNRSHSVTAQLVIPEGGAEGVIIAQGGAFGGWSLYLKEGRPTYCYNLLGVARFKVAGGEPLAPGERQVRMEFAYDGGGLGKGGDVTLYVDGAEVGGGRVEGTMPLLFSGDETTDLGTDTGTPVSDDYASADCAFTGKVEWVQVDVDEAAEDPDHLITPEERLRVALARQ